MLWYVKIMRNFCKLIFKSTFFYSVHCSYDHFQGKAELRCPVCKKEWSYTEVRTLAKLTPEEQQFFEETLANNATRKIVDIKNVSMVFITPFYS